MILLIQNIEDYNNDLRVSLQAFYGGERIVVPEIFDKKPELKAEIDKELVADIDDNRINIELYSVVDGGERTLACSTQIPVDIDKEIERLEKEAAKLAGEIKRASGMLANPKFVDKAPAAKVEEEKAKLAKYTEMSEQVAERLAQLKK